MGHYCPECGQACYGEGDIDDIMFDDNDTCEHCPLGGRDDEDYDHEEASDHGE